MSGIAPEGGVGSGTTDLLGEYLAALRRGDRRGAFSAVERARARGHSLEVIYLELFQPALREIGRLWQLNELSVAEEHFATAVTQTAMLRLVVAAPPRPVGVRTLVASCAEAERHEVGLRMLCDLLDEAGWETTYLGAAVPARDLVALVEERRPDAVALSASIAPHLPQIERTIALLRESGGGRPFILVGGRPFLDDPELATRLGADATAADARLAVAHLRGLFP